MEDSFVYEAKGPTLIIHLPKEFDHHNCRNLRYETDLLMAENYVSRIIFDFTRTRFMDSSGIGVLLNRYKQMKAGHTSFYGACPSMGPMYYYNQGDTRWSSYLYGGSDPMQQYGCGPTAAAMLISSFTNGGEAITPVTIADWSSANGYYAPQSGSYHSLIPSVLTAYGFQVESVTDHSPQNAASLLSSGHILVALMGKGSLTQNGHFVLITKLLPDGNVSIADPNSFDNSTCEWELPLLMEELKKVYDSGAPLWAVSMAASNSSLS